ncbi:MAG: DMT family transporter [bacterium]|nr:DMT family transporter [bacterium]
MGISVTFGEFLALGGALISACSSLILRTQSFKVPPVVMNAVRCGTATVFFWILLLVWGPPLRSYLEVPFHAWAFLLGGVMIGPVVGETAYLRAIREIGVSRSLALAGTYPLSTLFFQHLILQYPVPKSLVLGCVLVVLGVVSLSGRPEQVSVGGIAGPPVRMRLGVLLVLLAVTLWGLSTILLKLAIEDLTVLQANSIRMPQVATVLFLTHFWAGGKVRLKDIERRAIWIVAGTGVLSMGLGSLMFLKALELIGPAKCATLSSVAPVFGLILAVIFLKEKATVRLVVGVALCVTGVWVVL